jgi:hypothetical protein
MTKISTYLSIYTPVICILLISIFFLLYSYFNHDTEVSDLYDKQVTVHIGQHTTIKPHLQNTYPPYAVFGKFPLGLHVDSITGIIQGIPKKQHVTKGKYTISSDNGTKYHSVHIRIAYDKIKHIRYETDKLQYVESTSQSFIYDPKIKTHHGFKKPNIHFQIKNEPTIVDKKLTNIHVNKSTGRVTLKTSKPFLHPLIVSATYSHHSIQDPSKKNTETVDLQPLVINIGKQSSIGEHESITDKLTTIQVKNTGTVPNLANFNDYTLTGKYKFTHSDGQIIGFSNDCTHILVQQTDDSGTIVAKHYTVTDNTMKQSEYEHDIKADLTKPISLTVTSSQKILTASVYDHDPHKVLIQELNKPNDTSSVSHKLSKRTESPINSIICDGDYVHYMTDSKHLHSMHLGTVTIQAKHDDTHITKSLHLNTDASFIPHLFNITKSTDHDGGDRNSEKSNIGIHVSSDKILHTLFHTSL